VTILYQKKQAVLEGEASVEEAEALWTWLRRRKAPAVQLAGCTAMHSAVLQVLLVARPAILSAPADPWLARALGLDAPPRD
jgi:hypothetical protein